MIFNGLLPFFAVKIILILALCVNPFCTDLNKTGQSVNLFRTFSVWIFYLQKAACPLYKIGKDCYNLL